MVRLVYSSCLWKNEKKHGIKSKQKINGKDRIRIKRIMDSNITDNMITMKELKKGWSPNLMEKILKI